MIKQFLCFVGTGVLMGAYAGAALGFSASMILWVINSFIDKM